MNYSSFHCFSTATVFLPTLVPSNAKFLVTVFSSNWLPGGLLFFSASGLGVIRKWGGGGGGGKEGGGGWGGGGGGGGGGGTK